MVGGGLGVGFGSPAKATGAATTTAARARARASARGERTRIEGLPVRTSAQSTSERARSGQGFGPSPRADPLTVGPRGRRYAYFWRSRYVPPVKSARRRDISGACGPTPIAWIVTRRIRALSPIAEPITSGSFTFASHGIPAVSTTISSGPVAHDAASF